MFSKVILVQKRFHFMLIQLQLMYEGMTNLPNHNNNHEYKDMKSIANLIN